MTLACPLSPQAHRLVEKLNIETNDNHPMRITVTELMGVGKDEKIKLWFSETLLCTHHFFMLVCLYALLYIISTE